MRLLRPLIVSFANHWQAILLALATFKPFVVQEQSTPNVDSGFKFCGILGSSPETHLDNATFTGTCIGRTARFLGIPYAQPPSGNQRLRLPEPLPPYEGTYEAHKYGPSCPQQRMVIPQGLNIRLRQEVGAILALMKEGVTLDDEDCLTINVLAPNGATMGSNLPVLVWIFAGGFEIGGTATFDGSLLVERSIEIGEPVIFVSMNYRVSALGFLPGKEVKNAKIGNLGLQDQRLALKWVQKYISAFGGDPSKVTIWGDSSGAISVALHMLANNGDQEGLFRGAIMQSGGPIPVGDIEHGQQYYDTLVKKAACDKSPDTLECLRNIPYERFKYAMDDSPDFLAHQGLALAWLPRVDGVFLTEPPQHAVVRGHVSNVPMITGNCDDEGTFFSLSTRNITTTAQVGQYFRNFMMPMASQSHVDLLLQYYPEDVKAGSPFNTGYLNILSRQFKRIAAIQGDIVFHAPRRFLLKYLADKQNSWAYLYKRGKHTPFIGSAHATDLLNAFGGQELSDYIIYFTRNLDPNGHREVNWPKYDIRDPKLLVFKDNPIFPVIVESDNYRIDPLEFVTNISLLYPN